LDEKGLPVAWVVQVGSFAAQPNADKVKKALQDKGFKAYTQTVKAGSGSAIKVYVGPKLSRERADAQKHAIDQALKMNTMVVRFPVN
jgi:DedD protein